MAAIRYSCPISVVSTNEKAAVFQIDILQTEGLVRVYTDGQTDGYVYIDSACHADNL